MADLNGWLNLCRKARSIEIGDSAVRSALNDGRAALVLTASDAGQALMRKAELHAGRAGVKMLDSGMSSAELGFALGRATVAIAAITNRGMAAQIISAIDIQP